jgi:hypothetical protein
MSLTTVLVLNALLAALIFGLLAQVMRTPFLLDRRRRPARGLPDLRPEPELPGRRRDGASIRVWPPPLREVPGATLRVGERARRQSREAGPGL